MTTTIRALSFALIAGAIQAQNCAGAATGAVPLIDLGTGLHQGFEGGLYPGGQNARPSTHDAAGLAQAAAVIPRLPGGAPAAPGDPAGRIVLLSIGMSNTTQEFSTFVPASNGDVNRNPRLVVVDGAQGGQTATAISNPNANFWTVIQNRLANAGVTPQQVQVCWMKEAEAGPTQAFPADAVALQATLKTVCQVLMTKYPNLRICYVSSRIYAGYATTPLNPEPFAYQSGFAVKWLIQEQIDGDPLLNFDAAAGPVTSPWLAWGPYLWADGLNPRSDGLTWACGEFSADGTHPGVLARFKVAGMLEQFFKTDTTAVPWYVAAAPHPVRASTFFYGAPCLGFAGPPNLLIPQPPALGGLFSIGAIQARPNSLGVVFVSQGHDDAPIAGACHAYVDEGQLVFPDAFTFLAFTTNANGAGSFVTAIPNDPSLMGYVAFAQVFVSDASGAAFPQYGGAAFTRAARLTLGTP